jgi:hypothetical protein
MCSLHDLPFCYEIKAWVYPMNHEDALKVLFLRVGIKLVHLSLFFLIMVLDEIIVMVLCISTAGIYMRFWMHWSNKNNYVFMLHCSIDKTWKMLKYLYMQLTVIYQLMKNCLWHSNTLVQYDGNKHKTIWIVIMLFWDRTYLLVVYNACRCRTTGLEIVNCNIKIRGWYRHTYVQLDFEPSAS